MARDDPNRGEDRLSLDRLTAGRNFENELINIHNIVTQVESDLGENRIRQNTTDQNTKTQEHRQLTEINRLDIKDVQKRVQTRSS